MERKRRQAVSASQSWKERMQKAKDDRPAGIGQQAIIVKVVEINPSLDRLTLANRWRNAWLVKSADPEITEAVEAAVLHFKSKAQTIRQRLARQKLVS
ncbi:hypothetical protein [Spirosoma endbachense]|uniref:Uncharacterized protein n=1 Tax=Spirosoma endbachense TaxID=2666025 RepID=A0A6P1W2G6_9BACT|nr:hypothetical protein [Spirosoma endbachense]QHV97866.1 hypothetical protein GJR95_23930 [Spirosoma endbachense]